MPSLFRNTESMTGRLAMFFITVAITVGIFCLVLLSIVLAWSEDRVGERRILIDKQQAIEYFRSAPDQESVQLDPLTIAYNGLSAVPTRIQDYLRNHEQYIGEIGQGSDSRMLYMTPYTQRGESRHLVLISRIDEIEISLQEYINVMAIVLALVVLLIGSFTAILTRLSRSLIQPINHLCAQLSEHQGDTNRVFSVPEGSAQEFLTLANTLNQYRSDMDELMKREQAFARYASHELRTPLTVMKGSTSLLAKHEHTPFAQRQIDRIQSATHQMLTMVDALLSLVRYEKSHDNAPERAISAQELSDIIAKQKAQADAKQLTVTYDVFGTPRTRASVAIIEIVLGNLIRNSIAATAQGSIYIRMDTHSIDVMDEGGGFSPSSQGEGHGLGLLIIQDICQRYQWRFSLTDRASGGCHARVEMPL